MNFVLNGQGHGDVASVLMANNFDAGALRPFIGADGQARITVNHGGTPQTLITNATATLRKDEWVMLDTAVIKAARQRLNVVADLRSAGLQFTVPNGLGKTVLEHEAMSDIGDATVSMDGIREGDRNRPQFDLRSLPLPITHKDFSFSARQIAASRNGGSPLDTTMAEAAARKVAEEIEKLTIGSSTGIAYGGGQVYGFMNYPYRLTKSLTAINPASYYTVVNDVLAMRKQSTDKGYFGPWVLYYSPAWYAHMDADYDASNRNGSTLVQRLKMIEGITAVRPADFLTGTTLLLVQQTSDVARIVMGMDVTTVQWESQGGMQLNFKVMAIMVPQLRSDYTNATGIVHGTV